MKHIIPGVAIIDLHAARSILLVNAYEVGRLRLEVHYKGSAKLSLPMPTEEAKVEFDRICAAIAAWVERNPGKENQT